MAGILVSAAITLASASAAAAARESDAQFWTQTSLSGPLREGGRLLVHADVQSRSFDGMSRLAELHFRSGLGWRLGAVDLVGGYAQIRDLETPDEVQHRLWQQASYPVAKILGVAVTGRTRLERRFEAGENANRIRQQVRLTRRIGASPVSAIVWNEVFLGLDGSSFQKSGYGQNRGFAGVGLRLTSKLRADIGYLRQHVAGVGAEPEERNHILSLTVTLAP